MRSIGCSPRTLDLTRQPGATNLQNKKNKKRYLGCLAYVVSGMFYSSVVANRRQPNLYRMGGGGAIFRALFFRGLRAAFTSAWHGCTHPIPCAFRVHDMCTALELLVTLPATTNRPSMYNTRSFVYHLLPLTTFGLLFYLVFIYSRVGISCTRLISSYIYFFSTRLFFSTCIFVQGHWLKWFTLVGSSESGDAPPLLA